MRILSDNVLADTITALGMMICFYYSLTAYACVWYFRRSLFASLRHALLRGLCPLLGALILSVIFWQTALASLSPDFGSGSHLGGIGLVFIIAVGDPGAGSGADAVRPLACAGVLPGRNPGGTAAPGLRRRAGARPQGQ